MADAILGKSVLVTGGAGFIGSHLVDALVGRGARVRVLDNFATGARANLETVRDQIEILEGDLRDAETCDRACRGCEVVFHQAALGSVPRSLADPATTFAVNVGGTANIFAAARNAGTRRVVYASSSSVYGDSEELPKVEGCEGRPLSPYAWSKWMNEELAAAFGAAYGLELVGLRYFNVYGPRQSPEGPYAAVIPLFFLALLRNEPAVIHGDGGQSRDFTAVTDAVAANLLAADAPPDALGRAFNVAGGERITINRLLECIGATLGRPAEARFVEPRPGDVRHSLADLSAARELLSYQPNTGLEAGLAASIDYYRECDQKRI